jgi:transcriptional regulator with XRE-family HTH domain
MRTKEEIRDAKLLGQALAALRATKRLSQGEVGAKAGVSRQTVFNAEKGRHHPRQPALKKILRGLGVTRADLLRAQESLEAASEEPPDVGADLLPEDALLAAVEMAQEASRSLARCLALLKIAARAGRAAPVPVKRSGGRPDPLTPRRHGREASTVAALGADRLPRRMGLS